MANEKKMIDLSKLSSDELSKLKSEVLQRLLKGQKMERNVESDLGGASISHNRHSSVHSKG
jgi:hypothetical protein